jgi:PhzF family phenazine biosynthesis protein
MAKATYDFVTLDVFTTTRYAGNPLAVIKVPASATLTQVQKQAIAKEFNLSETAFLHDRSGAALHWAVDIFTTDQELPFAGHPTIGTACYALGGILAAGKHEGEEFVDGAFDVKAGRIGIRYDVRRGTAKADIPHDFHVHSQAYGRDSLLKNQPGLKAVLASGTGSMRSEFPVVSIVKGMTFILVELASEKELSAVSTFGSPVQFAGLDEEWNETFVGLYFFAWLGVEEDGVAKLRTRMIEGALEDPATGSAASTLAAYLSLMEGKAGDRMAYELVQGVEMGRRSEIGVEVVLADKGIETISLIGSAVQVMEGRLTV